MNDFVLHPKTRKQVVAFTDTPSHAIMLVGPTGSGKRSLAVSMAETVLGLPAGKFAEHPYGLLVAPEDGKAISIEAVRQLEQFLALKVPGKSAHDRVIIIEEAQLLSPQAQNALLKTLEEPPAGTILILTVAYEQAVLPTIRSRAQSIPIGRLERSNLEAHFSKQNFDEQAIKQAYAISGGLAGLMHALLHETEHPLLAATERARQLLSQTAYERLITVDELSKQKQLAIDVTGILQQMAQVSLLTSGGAAAAKWQQVLNAGYEANEALLGSAQPKLALTKLMLSL